MDVSRIWDRFIMDFPRALDIAKNYGSGGNKPDMEIEMMWKSALKQFFQTRSFTDIVLKDKYEFESPLNPELWDAWLRASADPEKHLVEWIRRGVLLGMSKEIPCCGIFPMADDPEMEMEEVPELADQLGVANYKSFTDEPAHARAELGRLVEEGFAVVLPTAHPSDERSFSSSRLAFFDTPNCGRVSCVTCVCSQTLFDGSDAGLPPGGP